MIENLIFDIFLNKIIIVIINFTAVFLAFLIYKDNPRGKANKLYLLMTSMMMTWVSFAYFSRVCEKEYQLHDLSLILLKIAWLATPLFFYFLYLFALNIVNKEKKFKWLNKFILIVVIFLSFISGFTDYVIGNVELVNNVFNIVYGPLIYVFIIGSFAITLATLLPVFMGYKVHIKSTRFFLIGLLVFYINNAIFNLILPVFLQNARFYFLGDYSTLILLSLTAYSIAKHEFFHIKVIAAQLITFGIWIAIFIQFFVVDTFDERLLNGGIFFFTAIFGVLLIRSVKNEIKQREKMEKLTLQLKVANLKLKKLDAVKSEFISIASHQLRTPLTVIKGYLSMIRDGDFGALGEKLINPLEKIYDSSERMILLVANLLNVSRIESGKIQFNYTEMQLEDLVKSVYEELQSKAKLKNLRFNYVAPPASLPKVRIDEEKIRQVIMNLTENSIKYTNEGSVTMKLKLEGKDIRFCVYDTGAGIKKSDMGKLFQKFSRGTGSTQAIEGTGLGLFVAKQMIEAHRGAVWAESKGEGKGSKFCFTLPINSK